MRIGHLMALVGLSVACAAPLASADGTPRIAVVRTFEVIPQMAEWKEHQKKYKAETAQLNAALQKKKDDLLAMAAQRRQYNPSHPSYNDLSAKIDQANIELQAWQQNVERQEDREKKLVFRDIFHHIQQATAKVAKAQQIDLVLSEGEVEMPDIETLTYQELMMDVAGRSVLYSTKALDISNAVLTQADADYAASQKNGSVVTPSQPPPLNTKPQGAGSNH